MTLNEFQDLVARYMTMAQEESESCGLSSCGITHKQSGLTIDDIAKAVSKVDAPREEIIAAARAKGFLLCMSSTEEACTTKSIN